MPNKKNIRRIGITEKMIPKVVDNEDAEMIRVIIDDHLASCFLHDRGWASTKVVIMFDEEHPRWGKCFATKYFLFERPGKMKWGHDGECMNIEKYVEIGSI